MMATALDLQSLARLSSERLLNCAVEGIGIALLVWILLRALGRRNSGTRFAVWFTGLLAIAGLPLFGRFAASGAAAGHRSGIALPGSWALYLFAVWVLMAGVGLTRVGIGLWQLRRLRKNCVSVDVAALDPVLRKTLEECDSPRAVKVCVSDSVRVPTAIGFVKPLVLIPRWTMQELSPAELNSILLHELAHLRRWDDWTNLVQKILGALLFFHPAVWWIEKELTLEREMACDDLVLAQAASPRAYAECLVSLAEKSFLRRGLALAQAAVDRMRHVSLRVAQILDADRPRATRLWGPPVLLTGISLLCLIGFSKTPTIISFENNAVSPPVTTSMAPSDFEAGQISHIGAQVVPAKLQVCSGQVRPEDKGSASGVAKSVVRNSFRTTSKLGVMPVRSVQRNVKAPMVVRTSMANDAAAPQTLFLVMRTEVVQTRQYDASGAVVWDMWVWQVTVVGPVQDRMEAGIIAKFI